MTSATAAWSAAETAQALARTTRDGYRDPLEAYDTIAGLTAATAALPQLLRQTARWLHAEHLRGTLRTDSDTGDGVDRVATAARASLRDAVDAAECLTMLLEATTQRLATLSIEQTAS
jgi:hypothetical protein